MPEKVSISDLRKLDKKLSKLETKHKKELEKVYSNFNTQASGQTKRFNDGKIDSIKLKSSSQSGLEKTYKNYFREVDKLSSKSTKMELMKNAKTQTQKDLIKNLKYNDDKDYLQRAKDLSAKQIKDYEAGLTDKLQAAKGMDKQLKSKDLKGIVNDHTQGFKNVRKDLTIEFEGNRITNNIRIEMAKASGIVKGFIFNAVLDNRTTKHICLPRHRTVLPLDSGQLPHYQPPLHSHCRSYLNFVNIDSKIKNTSESKINKIVNDYPIAPESIKIRDEGF